MLGVKMGKESCIWLIVENTGCKSKRGRLQLALFDKSVYEEKQPNLAKNAVLVESYINTGNNKNALLRPFGDEIWVYERFRGSVLSYRPAMVSYLTPYSSPTAFTVKGINTEYLVGVEVGRG